MPDILAHLFAFILGSILGSFNTMASYRIVNKTSFFGRSHCPKCKKQLSVFDLIPIFSYLLISGKCRNCHNKISIRYPLIEFFTGLNFVINWHIFNANPTYLILITLISLILILIITIDFEHMIIPDELTLIMGGLGIIYAWYEGYSLAQIFSLPLLIITIALLLKYGFKLIYKKDGLGMGDVKFMTIAGIYLTPDLLSYFLFFSGILGIGLAILWKILKKGEKFPFGPALSMSLYICLIEKNKLEFMNILIN
jgi:leader peptidase (prepilin peptidase)/N-methyltransferase